MMTREEILQVSKPILFNTEMVRAILDGRKTVTRRIMKLQPWKIGEGEYECRHEKGFYDMGGNDWVCRQCGCGVIPMKGGSYFHAPYQPGDILYVRETWGDYRECIDCGCGYYMYRADYPEGSNTYLYNDGTVCDLPKWHPSIHMPKEAARIFLRVTDVRVERLHDMSPATVFHEGTKERDIPALAMCEFANIWDSTIQKKELGKYGWYANPWVWVIEFERVEEDSGDK